MKKKLFKRIMSFVLAIAMVLTMSSVSSVGMIVAKAAEAAYKLYFELPEGTVATDWAFNVWGGAAVVSGDTDNAFRPTPWGEGATFPALLADDELAGWAYVEVSGTIEGLQFVNAAGEEYNCWNSQIAAQNIEAAYFAPADQKWYKEAEKTNEIKAAEIQNIFVVAGAAGLTGTNWSIATDNNPGLMTQSADDSDVFSVTFKNVDKGTYEYKILQDPANKGWNLAWGYGSAAGGNRSVEVAEDGLNVTISINLKDQTVNDADGGVSVSFEKPEKQEYIPSTSFIISDSAKLVVDNDEAQTYEMKLTNIGTYNAVIDMEAGEHTVEVLINNEKTTYTKSVSIDKDTTVSFALNEKKGLQDSVNDGLIHTAALAGSYADLAFVNEDGEAIEVAAWSPADPNVELDYIGNGLYQGTFRFKKTTADTAIEFKVAFDDSWDYSIGKNGSNYSLVIPAGKEAITVLCDERNEKIYTDVDNAFGKNVSLIGTVRQGNDWTADAKGFEMTQVSETLYVYSSILPAGTWSYKYIEDYANWMGGENINFTTTDEETFVVFVYDSATGKICDSVNKNEAVAELVGMTPTPNGAKVINNANGTTKFQTVATTGAKVVLNYSLDKTDYKNVTLTEIKAGLFSTDNIFLGDEEIDATYYYTIDGVDGEKISYKRAKFEGRCVNVPGTFPGKNWDAASNQMTYLGNGLYSYTFEQVPAANYEYKISFGSWNENYGVGGIADGANYKVTVPSVQDVTVYYTDLATHLSVTSLNYKFADVYVEGEGVAKTKLTDEGLSGIYSAAVSLEAGTYKNVVITADGKQIGDASTVTVEEAKAVTFFYAPAYDIVYNDSAPWSADDSKIVYDTKNTKYKSIYGAVPTDTEVTFKIKTDASVTAAKMVVKLGDTKTLDMTKKLCKDGTINWTLTTKFDSIGEYDYFFILYSGGAIKVYGDDSAADYGKGVLSSLSSIVPYDLVVYEKGFETPDWMKNGVIYQIFPDRFANGNTANDKAQTSSRGAVDYEFPEWEALPENPEQEKLLEADVYKSTGAYYGDGNWSNEMYGGDLEGITKNIDYLKKLGVTVIYLNPVFSSISSHRYDATDYSKIDPILGDLGDFEELCKVAEENGMKVVLDGVFNHVSDDSIYFDRYYKFLTASDFDGKIGAYPYWAYVYDYMAANEDVSLATAEDIAKNYFTEKYNVTDFSYTTWFNVYQDSYLVDDEDLAVTDSIGLRAGEPVYGYEGWWGYDSMPVIKSTNGSEYQTEDWAKTIIGNEEKNNGSITQYWISEGSDGWRLDVANEVSDETWQNFRKSVKAMDSEAVIIGEIWTDATNYLLGDMYDSVMNYVFRGAVLNYAMSGKASDTMATLEKTRERYPEEAFYAMMNLVGSHDTSRVLSYLDGIGDDRNDKSIEAAFPTYENTSDLAKKRQYLVAFLQFTYAGAPTIYYGDEIGMVGADDPDDRRAFEWNRVEGNELLAYYSKLAAIRNNNSALRTGSVEPVDTDNENVLGYIRADKSKTFIVLANNSEEAINYTIDSKAVRLVTEGKITDILSGTEYKAADKVEVTIPALSGLILEVERKAEEPVENEEIEEEPVVTPTAVPTTAPTAVPTTVPTAAPTVAPTAEPTTVATPVVTPTATPTASPVIGADEKAPTVTTVSKPGKVKLSKKTVKKTSIKVSWKKVSGATGYQIQYSTSKKFAKKYTKTKKLKASKKTVTLKKLKKNKKYYVRIRAVKKVDGNIVAGKWTSISVKTKK